MERAFKDEDLHRSAPNEAAIPRTQISVAQQMVPINA
jgi:hypothetical protein